ncbi:MAG TPA: M20/M25/M40 family metallo-hydrolase [Thermoanaerobaculia bacterium]|nr:M20/M25/M40 family metallo-hydrolase [Thermoanaerobaculia bacterium]
MAFAAVDRTRALQHLLDLLAIEGLSGREGKVAAAVRAKLLAAGCRPGWVRHDRVHERLPGYEVGNLIVRLPGTDGIRDASPRLFMGHMDTVPLVRGAKAIRKGGRITSAGSTALGGDNRTACAALVTLVETLLRDRLPHPPLTLLFTVGEEVGLLGARHVDLDDLGRPAMGFNIDGGDPAEITIGAIGADRWEVDVRGKAAHAGVAPERGISAALIASRAIADVARRGYFGKVKKGRHEGTSNVGILRGGEATNQVTDHVYVRGESRSHAPRFIDEITGAYRAAFTRAAKSVTDDRGRSGAVEFRAARDYDSFRMAEDSPPVVLAIRAGVRLRLDPRTRIANGGLDANYLNAKGVPTVTLGAGQHAPHTVDEYVDVREFVGGCRLLVAIATEP